ncbi:MAG: arylsulfatase A-like enzyme [Rhodothermales bacterium]|jgi:arylsulfatase A-like enzyme
MTAKGYYQMKNDPLLQRKRFVITLTTTLCLLAGMSLAFAQRPNVIFIKSDDQRFDSLGMTGHPVTQTPHIDQLAKDGVFFENAFITSPICGPSRANFFTGQWERKNRQGFGYISGNHIPTALFDKSWLMQLKNAGCFTGYIGKHHAQIGPQKEQNRYMKERFDFLLHEARTPGL